LMKKYYGGGQYKLQWFVILWGINAAGLISSKS
jgi:hypothetical protein